MTMNWFIAFCCFREWVVLNARCLFTQARGFDLKGISSHFYMGNRREDFCFQKKALFEGFEGFEMSKCKKLKIGLLLKKFMLNRWSRMSWGWISWLSHGCGLFIFDTLKPHWLSVSFLVNLRGFKELLKMESFSTEQQWQTFSYLTLYNKGCLLLLLWQVPTTFNATDQRDNTQISTTSHNRHSSMRRG